MSIKTVLHVYIVFGGADDIEWFVAENAVHARQLYMDEVGLEPVDIREEPDGVVATVQVGDEDGHYVPEKRPWATWAAEHGAGWFASTEEA